LHAMFGAVCKPCSVKDEASTVKVDMSKLGESGLAPEAENERREREEEEARKRREGEDAQRLRKEKECKDAEEQKRRREEEQAAAETQRCEDEERARRQREEEEEQEAERLRQEKEREQALEAERQRAAEEKAKEEADLREQLNAWLKKNGLADANAKKKTMLPPSHCYPLHIAIKQKDARMVRALVLFGADKSTKNSSGQMALDLANKSNKGKSHDEIIAALR